LQGLNVWDGQVTNKPVAEALGYDFVAPETALA
jgi:alanine dehydrogenase